VVKQHPHDRLGEHDEPDRRRQRQTERQHETLPRSPRKRDIVGLRVRQFRHQHGAQRHADEAKR
jgi:hypothetical protein